MSTYTINKISIIGIVLCVCVLIVTVFAYAQIPILQRNASDLETSKNYLQNQVSALQNQVDTLNAYKASLENQVTVLQNEANELLHELADNISPEELQYFTVFKDVPREDWCYYLVCMHALDKVIK